MILDEYQTDISKDYRKAIKIITFKFAIFVNLENIVIWALLL